MTVLKTPRLDLRKFEVNDASFFFEMNNDPLVMTYTGDLPFESVETARQFVENYDHYTKHGYGRWTVVLRQTGEPIGFCGLKNHPDEGYIDLGYRIIQSEWGKGYATEAAQACIIYGFHHLGMDEIVGRTAQDNIGSIRVLEKVDMQFWKHAPCEGIEDSVYYKIKKT
ncbi:MAG: ribosomal-protein-alanine N-acetyltransferase [Bacteroidia bacterium]|jgi:ribosomal-protein-alanine N-acetyltransferase